MQGPQFSERPHADQSRSPQSPPIRSTSQDDDFTTGPWDELLDFLLFARDKFSDQLDRLWAFFSTEEFTSHQGESDSERAAEQSALTPTLRRQSFEETSPSHTRSRTQKQSSSQISVGSANSQFPINADHLAPRTPVLLWCWNLWSRTVWPLTVTTGSLAIALTIYLLIGLLFADQPLQKQAEASNDFPVHDPTALGDTISFPSSEAPLWTPIKPLQPRPQTDPFTWPNPPPNTVTPASSQAQIPNPESRVPSLSLQRFHTSWIPNFQLPPNNILRVSGRGYYQPAYRHSVTSLSSQHAPWRRHYPAATIPTSPWMTDVGPYYQPGLHFLDVSNDTPHPTTVPLDGHLPSAATVSFVINKAFPREHSSTSEAHIAYQITNTGSAPLKEILIDEQLWQPDPSRPNDPILHDEAEYRVHQLLAGETAVSQAVFPTKEMKGKLHAYAYITASSQVEAVTHVAQHQVDLEMNLLPETKVGQLTKLVVHITNKGQTTFPGGTITLNIPESFQYPNGPNPQTQVGILGPGQSATNTYALMPISAAKTHISAQLTRESAAPLERHAPITVFAQNTQPQKPTPQPSPLPNPETRSPKPDINQPPFFEPQPFPQPQPTPNPKPDQPPQPPIEIPKETPLPKPANNAGCCQPCQAQSRPAQPPIQQPVYYPSYEQFYPKILVPTVYAY